MAAFGAGLPSPFLQATGSLESRLMQASTQSFQNAWVSARLLRRIGADSVPAFRSVLLHVQLVLGGLLGFAHFIHDPVTDGLGPLSTIAAPLRTGATVLVIVLALGTGSRIKLRPIHGLIAAYCLYLCGTAAISPDPLSTLRYAIDFALVMLAFTLITANMPAFLIVDALLNVMAATMILSTLDALLLPSSGVIDAAASWGGDSQVGSWRGIFEEKNGLGTGASAALGTMFAAWRIWRAPQPFKVAGVVATLACFYMARSANGLAGFAAIVGADIVLRGRVPALRSALTWLAVVAGALVIAFSPYLENLFELVGRDSSGSNRTLIWAYSINVWQISPWYGHGFVEGTNTVLQPGLVSALGKAARHAHNGYIEGLVDTGIIGTSMLVAQMLYALTMVSVRDPARDPVQAIASRGLQAAILGGLVMAVGDIATFRMVGGLGIVTWCVVASSAGLALAPPRPALRR